MNTKRALQQVIDSFANINIQPWKTVLEHDFPLKPGSIFITFDVILKADASLE